MNILAIDFGLTKIGLALADEESKLPFPLKVIKVKNLSSQQMVELLKEICLKENVKKVVLGIPEGEMAKKIRIFGEELTRATGFSLVYEDESLTSKDALAKMIAAGKKKKTRSEEDAFAAALILEKYFENN